VHGIELICLHACKTDQPVKPANICHRINYTRIDKVLQLDYEC